MGQIRKGIESQAEEVRFNVVENREPMKLSEKGSDTWKVIAFKDG